MLCVFTSCERDDVNLGGTASGAWEKKAVFAGEARSGAVTFMIDGIPYIGTGYDGANRLSDFWQYDATADTWIRKADFPGVPRSGAVGFSANGKGYIGTGYDGTSNLQDFWQYDPATDTWAQIADFAGSARYGAIAMSLDNRGYVGAGFDGAYRKDFWQYDEATNTWVQKTELSGARRVNGFAFVVNNKGYIGGGRNNGIMEADLMEYDPGTDTWRNLKNLNANDRGGVAGNDFPVPRADAATFVVNNKAYVVGGSTGATPNEATAINEVWEFDPANDAWRKLNNFRGGNREGAIGFAIGEDGYVALGKTRTTVFSDVWQLTSANSGD
jgi:N-acetylneuraminic acid mutarotase